MNPTEEKAAFADIRRKIRETMDREWRNEGKSQEELETSRKLSDLFACELAAGRTPQEIEVAWAGKTAEQIIREYALPAPTASQHP